MIQPLRKKTLCINSHPQGCTYNVNQEIALAKTMTGDAPFKKVLVIGASTGFGLSSRIAAAFSLEADTLGVYRSSPPRPGKEGNAGYNNSQAFIQAARELPGNHLDVVGDAFSQETKETVIQALRDGFGPVDLVIYSIAAPRRKTNQGNYRSTIKPVGQPVKVLDLDMDSQSLSEITLEPASQTEIEETRKVMGGEDWQAWMMALKGADLLQEDCQTIAYTYLGSDLTRAIYNDGTIGKAKDHLLETAESLRQEGIIAQVISQPAVVTQSSSVIPSIGLYLTLLNHVYQELGIQENQQTIMARMFEKLKDPREVLVYNNETELSPEVQNALKSAWDKLKADESLPKEYAGWSFKEAFLNLFGFELPQEAYQD